MFQSIVKAAGLAENQVATSHDDHALAGIDTDQAQHVFGQAVKVILPRSLHFAAAGGVLCRRILAAKRVLSGLL